MQLHYQTEIVYKHPKTGAIGSYTFFRKVNEYHAKDWCTNNDVRYICSTINRVK